MASNTRAPGNHNLIHQGWDASVLTSTSLVWEKTSKRNGYGRKLSHQSLQATLKFDWTIENLNVSGCPSSGHEPGPIKWLRAVFWPTEPSFDRQIHLWHWHHGSVNIDTELVPYNIQISNIFLINIHTLTTSPPELCHSKRPDCSIKNFTSMSQRLWINIDNNVSPLPRAHASLTADFELQKAKYRQGEALEAMNALLVCQSKMLSPEPLIMPGFTAFPF